MASITTDEDVEVTRYSLLFGTHNGFLTFPAGTTISDGESDTEFTTDDNLTVSVPGYSTFSATFLGTITIDGAVYPVVEAPSLLSIAVIGIELPSGTHPTSSGFSYDTSPLPESFEFPDCFAEGTLIATPTGECAVEELRIGDLVATADGRAVPVRWVGRQSIVKLFHRDRARMVRIGKGALGNHSDLLVTPDHGMVLQGHLINASALVNGHSICLEREIPNRFTVYHVETEDHDVILANGAAAETYLDLPDRKKFDNYRDYLDLYGEERLIAENPLPRIATQRMIPEPLRVGLGIDLGSMRIPA